MWRSINWFYIYYKKIDITRQLILFDLDVWLQTCHNIMIYNILQSQKMRPNSILLGFIFLLSCAVASKEKNVLFLMSDDLRPQLNCYQGKDFPSPVSPIMHTPNLDKLASTSLLLKRAYAQQGLCNPSRTSLLTSRRPDTTHVYDLHHYFRTFSGNFTTLPQYFKEQGYRTIGAGKVFHPGMESGHNDPISWTDPYYMPYESMHHWETYNHSWRAVSPAERKQIPLPDDLFTEFAIEKLKELVTTPGSETQPFFLAIGFLRPHPPITYPEEYSYYYPLDDIRLAPNPFVPVGMPYVAWWDMSYLRRFADIQAANITGAFNVTFPEDLAIDLRRAYYSSVTYIDDQVGKILQTLADLGLAENTIVSFLGDHGYMLGEHAEFCKETNFELGTHTPLMVRVPGLTDNGINTEALVEFVDIFPTLADAAGLPPLPICRQNFSQETELCREGSSFMPLVKNSSLPWKRAVFSQYPRPGEYQIFTKYMGYSVRVDKARYTEWIGFNITTFNPIWDVVNATELYDYSIDPEGNVNRADDPSYTNMRDSLREILHRGWRDVLSDVELDTDAGNSRTYS